MLQTLADSDARRPFWALTLVSGALALSSAGLSLVFYTQTGAWQYLAIAAVTLASFMAHAAAWALARAYGEFRKGILITAAGQIFCALLLPLFTENYWLVSPFVLVMVPFEAGLVDDLRRISRFIMVSLLGAAGMLMLDLWAPFERVQELTDVSAAGWLVGILLGAQIVLLSALLWGFRLRITSSSAVRLDLATQFSLVFTAMSAATIAVVVGVLIAQLRVAQIAQVGENIRALTLIDAERVGNGLSGQVDSLLALDLQNAVLQEARAQVTRSIKVTMLAGVLLMIGIVIVANRVARRLTRPIQALTETAAAISQGHLEQRARLAGPVELVTLAEAFNTLAAIQEMLINNLQGQVAERTEQLQVAKEAAEAANESKSAFLASVSHELRTPLTSVLGFARLIHKRLNERIFPRVVSDDPQIQRTIIQVNQNLSIVISEGERLTTLINNVLDLSKIEAGKIEWQMQPLQIAEVIDHAAAATAGLLGARPDLELRVEVEPGLPETIGDRDKLIQVVINLISNAVKFTPQGRITCRAGLDGDSLLVCVADTGVGIPAEHHDRVFEKFIQLGDTLTDKPQGTGLGLPICKEIVERHGGRIWLESAAGGGSRFFFSLPTRPDA